MKYTSIFVILRCCPVKIYHLSSWCNKATDFDTAGSTAGTKFFKYNLDRSTIFMNFQGHTEDDTTMCVIKFSEK